MVTAKEISVGRVLLTGNQPEPDSDVDRAVKESNQVAKGERRRPAVAASEQ